MNRAVTCWGQSYSRHCICCIAIIAILVIVWRRLRDQYMSTHVSSGLDSRVAFKVNVLNASVESEGSIVNDVLWIGGTSSKQSPFRNNGW